MSDEPNTYQYIVKKQAMLNVDKLNERIAELESTNKTLQEQNDNLSFISNRAGNVYREQRLNDFVGFINGHLLANDLEIELDDASEAGLIFHIPDALLIDGAISRTKKSFTVTGTLSLEWTAEVTASDEDEAYEVAERHIHDADVHAYFPHHEQVDEADIDTYSLNVEVSDTYEN
jgi:hypothetical protein